MAGATGRARRWVRRGCFAAIAALYVFAIPWYRDGSAPLTIVAGMPDWVATALACYALAGGLTAIAWWLTEVPGEREEDA